MEALIPSLSARAGLAVAIAILGGCYDPQLEDCTVSCVGPGECAAEQVCGADGFCAQPSVAGTCSATASPVTLEITIERQGRVELDLPAYTCEAHGNGGTVCVLDLAEPGWLDLRAIETDRSFDRWTAGCNGQESSCRLLVGLGANAVGARFR